MIDPVSGPMTGPVIAAALPWSWGATDAERAADYPCTALVPEPANRMIRAVDVAAPAEVVFRWLCQLRVAPYSYDLVDNLGRRSPRTLTPGLDDLVVDAPFLMIFKIASWVEGREITAAARSRRLGARACTYRVVPTGPASSRLVCRIDLAGRAGVVGRAVAWGDLVMMRRQLLTVAGLAAS